MPVTAQPLPPTLPSREIDPLGRATVMVQPAFPGNASVWVPPGHWYNALITTAVMLNVIALFAGHVAPVLIGVQMSSPAASKPLRT
jgi:hypothetical protein